jgi:molybdate/tungstate transport system permease protein
MKRQALQWVFSLLGAMILLFIMAPVLGLLFSSSPLKLFETARDPEVKNSILLTLGISMGGTLLFALAAVPFSWILARYRFPLKRLVTAIIDLPVVIPHSAAGIAVLGFVSRDTWLGKAGAFAGFNFVGHPAGIMIAMAFVSLPYLINAARDGFLSVPERLEKAALTLGASPLRVFFTISLPLAWKNILSGLILMFARGMSEFGAVVIIAYHPMVTPVLIYERFTSFGLKYAQPVSVIYILVVLVFFMIIRMLLSSSKKN